jgi:hypothetical protein
LKIYNDPAGRQLPKFNVLGLKEKVIAKEFGIELKGGFSVLSHLQEKTIDDQQHSLKEVLKTT